MIHTESFPVLSKGDIMSKTKIAAAVESTFKSISDFGYNVAKRADAVRGDGAWALDNLKGFPEDILSEDRAELNEGFRKRASELPKYEAVEYGVVDGNYIPLSQLYRTVDNSELPMERYIVSVASAFSYTQQQFGAMKSENPQLYLIVQDVRNRVNKYCSNCLSDLKAAARKVLKERNPETSTRAATKSFAEFVESTLDTMKQRCKTAEARGNDPTANLKALDAAIIAFKVKMEVVK
jgi:hypothetical protein